MSRATKLYSTTVGKKIVMALSGIVLAGFVVAHMAGNLHLFEGAAEINEYAAFLREVGSPLVPHGAALWASRVILLLALGVHVVSWLSVAGKSRDARRTGYRSYERKVFSKTSLTMAWAGVFIFLFVIFHLLHLTTGDAHPDFVQGDVYHNLVVGLGGWPMAAVYLGAAAAVALHLYHGIWSATQTLGLDYPRLDRYRRPVSIGIAVIVGLGFAAVPLAIATGVVS
ncbi:MAG: succinate dehydrogenase cytochrome b subunit [Gemmatimonadota bacterium]